MPTVPTEHACTECGRRVTRVRKGRCGPCYKRLLAVWERDRVVLRGLTPSERLWAKIDSSGGEDACWPYGGTIAHNGYGHIKVDDGMRLAHRMVYEECIGPIPDGRQVDHRCHDPRTCPAPTPSECLHRRCCNWRHLHATTPRENTLRSGSPAADNLGKTHCPQGHEYADENTRTDGRGKRYCRTCDRANWREWDVRRQEANRGAPPGTYTCPRCGHERDQTRVRNGMCSACTMARSRARQRGEDPDLAFGGPSLPDRCKRDHPFTVENTRVVLRPDGTVRQRMCRTCLREDARRRYTARG